MYKIVFFVPESHCEAVKLALFERGAGRFKGYDHCSWQTSGQGQFRPLAGSTPFLGREGEVAVVDELRVEMICNDAQIADCLEALIKAHPYEVPAYEAYRVLTLDDLL